MSAPEAATGFRFGWPEFAERARRGLHHEVPREGDDLTLTAVRGDDDLNPGVMLADDAGLGTRAAVLVPIIKREPQASMLLTQRNTALSSHAGQVAFPGGKFDRDDRDATACALREAFEETGLAPRFVRPVGYLDPYQTRTGFRVIPVVALVDTGFALSPAPDEVDAVFEVPLAFLMDPRHHRRETRTWQGSERHFYAMPWGERYIWGATAGMIRNLYERLYAMS
jgi:8-oxo-dGTP pyrophosphatase MutT (NUDIX family)